MPNLTNSLQSVDLSTVARIKTLSGGAWTESANDGMISAVIAEVSAQFVEVLGVHTLRAARTEVYEVRKFHKQVTLDAKEVAVPVVATMSSVPANLATAVAMTEGRDYRVLAPAGVIRLLGDQPWDPGFIQVAYTGGFFTDTGELGTKHHWLVSAAENQIIHRLQRRDTLGGNVQGPGGEGTSFIAGYDLLPSVAKTLMMHRRSTA